MRRPTFQFIDKYGEIWTLVEQPNGRKSVYHKIFGEGVWDNGNGLKLVNVVKD